VLETSSAIVGSDHVSQFRREGWTQIDDLLDMEQVATLHTALDAAEAAEAERQHWDPNYRSFHDDQRYRQMFTNLRVSAQRSKRLNIGWDTRIAGIARDLMGVEHVQLFQEGGLIKPPKLGGSRPTRWHQDLPLQPFDRRDSLTVWIALEDIPVERGPLTFLPGSHRLGPLGRVNASVEQVDLDASLREEDRELLGAAVTTPLKAGGATAHAALVVHSAGENLSSTPRRAWTIIYMSSETRYNGAPSPSCDGLDLKVNEPFDAEAFPLIV
jgi:phytanoyl-CoA hydroxylase